MTDSKIVLITGASSGIGEATARRLAADGHTVVVGARRADRLAVLAEQIHVTGGTVAFTELDVTDLASVRRFARLALDRFGRIDVLVNNAGIMPNSHLAELRVEDWNRMIDVNLRGVLHGIAAVLPAMEEQRAGHIVNIASVSGHQVDPTSAVYSATKHAVLAISEGLRQESTRFRVTVISPGLTASELTDHIPGADTRAYMKGLTDDNGIPASAVADGVAYAIAQPPEVDVNEIIIRPAAFA
ncbi:SDR family oxidoreductase [Streptomyces sp. NPDC002018]|uniref:SDR family oxidoreductase n=1 Tax=Streptomyces sp. NPDC002018 TaxID=3364629 RepID=UPI0036ADB92F